MLGYQDQNTALTLEEGLTEYYEYNAKDLSTRELTSEADTFFRCHDVVHVVFGCNISLEEELVVKISSLFGTDAGFAVLKGYALAESKEVYVHLSVTEVVLTTLKAFWLVPRTLVRCARMKARWRWIDHDEYMNQPLSTIRKTFGVVVNAER